MNPVISLCIPTNGISEWVFPVLDSVYAQDVPAEEFEVVVTDNGKDEDFARRMQDYAAGRPNLIYRRTEAVQFANQLEALKLASGEYLKFLNHREVLLEGSLKRMIAFIREQAAEKPVIYFSNGMLDGDGITECRSLDEFCFHLKRWISWTSGVGIWREQYEKLPENFAYDPISPHSSILFAERKRDRYLINNMPFSRDLTGSHEKKGKYDLFKAFAVEEVEIVLKLYISGDISRKTFEAVRKDYGKFVSLLYWQFAVRKEPCSYDLSGFDNVGIFFRKYRILARAYGRGILSTVKQAIVRKR